MICPTAATLQTLTCNDDDAAGGDDAGDDSGDDGDDDDDDGEDGEDIRWS